MSKITSIIKTTGIMVFILGIIGSIGYAISANEAYLYNQPDYMPFIYFLVGSFISFISCILIYGFGVLLEYVEAIDIKLNKLIKPSVQPVSDNTTTKIKDKTPYICDMCSKHCAMVQRYEIADSDNPKPMMICKECFDKMNNKQTL